MAQLTKHGAEVDTVFDLLGKKENDLSFSLGWALQQCPKFLAHVVHHFTGEWLTAEEHDRAAIRLQEHDQQKGGYTDLELDIPGRCFIVLELKLGWNLPTVAQLGRYARRRGFREQAYPYRAVVALSECSAIYSHHQLPPNNFRAAPLQHVNWHVLLQLARAARPASNNHGKRLLDQFLAYLTKATSMRSIHSNRVLVVSLAARTMHRWSINFMQVATERNRYFHPVGHRWPTEALNYIAFRYGGRLRAIHHIEEYVVTTDPNGIFPEANGEMFDRPHFIYTLGPAIPLRAEIPAGPRIRQSVRTWCMLDTLLTAGTITQAMEITRAREAAANVN